jgi:methylated-DNA-[protein]-cysteine S-methyltransferase
MFYQTSIPSPLGELTLACDELQNLVGLWFVGQKYYLGTLPHAPLRRDDLPVFDRTRQWLAAYFAGEMPSPASLPLSPVGGAFRQSVWKVLLTIPYGATTTYGAIARQIAAPGASVSAQAVGGAVGHNPLSIIIPCHRVVGADGTLTGYANGFQTKEWLLKHEGVLL